jgi:hypothetical protein
VDAEGHVGGRVKFTFLPDFNPVMEITELEQNERLVWRCVDGHAPWANNTFTFALADHEGGTRVRFWQYYAVELDDDAYATYNFNWGYYLNSLLLLCNTGSGQPFQVDDK